MEHIMLYPKIYQTVNRNPKSMNSKKGVQKKNEPVPRPFTKVKVIIFKVILHKLLVILVQKYQNKYVNI